MSAAFGQSRRRSRSRSGDLNDDYAKKSVLAKVKKSELKMLRVAVKGSSVIGEAPELPLERSIDDPAKICSYVHYRKERHSGSSRTNRSYKGVRNENPHRRSRSPQYGGPHPHNLHGEYEYYAGWGPGPRLPAGRGGFPMQPFYPPAFHPRYMMPGALIPPGLKLAPRFPIMPPYRPYQPYYPVYNIGAIAQRGSRPNVKPTTIASEKDDDSVGSGVV